MLTVNSDLQYFAVQDLSKRAYYLSSLNVELKGSTFHTTSNKLILALNKMSPFYNYDLARNRKGSKNNIVLKEK